MKAFLKDHVESLFVTAAIGLAVLQIITPMFVDIIFDGLIIGMLYAASKI